MHRLFEDFGSIWGGFGDDFSKVLRIFFENADLQNSCAQAVFREGRALRIQQKINKKTQKIDANLEWENKAQKIIQKMDLGRFGDPFGKVWDALGRLLATFARILGVFCRFFDVHNRIFFKHGSKMSSKKPFGSILDRF